MHAVTKTVNESAARRRPAEVVAGDGVRLFVRDWGEGRPVLFLHAWALSSGMWGEQAAALEAQGRRCIAFDRRGHGRSAAAQDAYGLDRLADDVADTIAALGLADLDIVAHSMGAAEALRYIARHGGDRVRRLVLLAPATPCLTARPDNPLGAPAEYFEALRGEMAADFAGWIDRNTEPFVTPATPPDVRAKLRAMMLATPVPVALACNRTLAAADVRPDLARLTAPTLVLHGDRDASAPLDITGRPTAAGIAGARLQVIEGAPHGLFVTHAEAVNAALTRFLGR
jgi:pimeloyl-ACP methyl ester carboxylesterase